VPDPQKIDISSLTSALQEAGDPDKTPHAKAYLKSDLVHLGVPVPQVRKVVRAWSRALEVSEHDSVMGVARLLWNEPASPTYAVLVYEYRAAAVELLDYRRAVLGVDDLIALRPFLDTANTWALIDPLAINIVGNTVVKHPEQCAEVTNTWSRDPDFWLRRTALLSQLPTLRSGDGDPSLFFEYADMMLHEKEFFIRKAIGWELRELGRKRPQLVFDWLAQRAQRASGVTIREALKPLDNQQRDAILLVWRDRSGP